MIKSLRLQNFQSHKDSLLEFNPGVNVIIGPSDSGKTAIIRIIRWIERNRPGGDAFRSTWGGQTTGTMETDEATVIRLRNNTENGYVLETGGKVKTDFKAIKTDVPEEIQIALNLNEINLQSQLDAPFLLSNSPGEVARHFNKVAHLDQIDKGLASVQKWLREIEQDVSSKDKQLTQSNEDLEGFIYLEKFEIDLEILEGMEKRMINEVTGKNKLVALVGKITEVSQEYTKQSYITKASALVNKILGWYDEKELVNKDSIKLDGLIKAIQGVNNRLKRESEILGIENLVDSLIQLHEDKFKNAAEVSSLEELVEKIRRTKKKILLANEKYESLHEKFDKEFPDICPLCNKPK